MSLDYDTRHLAAGFAAAASYTSWLQESTAPHLERMDEALAWRAGASPAERRDFDHLVDAVLASGVLAHTCGLRDKVAEAPWGLIGAIDSYNVNATRCALDDAVRAMLAVDLVVADTLLGKAADQLEQVLTRKRERATPNRAITAAQRRVIERMAREVRELRTRLVGVIAEVSP